EFSMTYITNSHKIRHLSPNSDELNGFFHSFWLQRQWILEIEVECDEITYLIHPYKKRWFEYNEQKEIDLSKSRQVILDIVSPEMWYSTLTIHDYIKHIHSAMKIDQLHIRPAIFVVKLIEILELLPELDALKLSTISFSDPRKVTQDEFIQMFCLTNQIRITKLYLGKIRQIQHVYFFLTICPLIKQLEINNLPKKMKIKLFLRLLLIQIKNRSKFSNLRLLCIRLPLIDDKMILKLKQMIQDESLLVDFTIKRMMDKVYLEWK
ncbi:unnamed protein product, partial [Adineta ricciae]